MAATFSVPSGNDPKKLIINPHNNTFIHLGISKDKGLPDLSSSMCQGVTQFA
jgi:hypothetical protein